MDLELFVNKITGKQITIESTNTEGEIGLKIMTTITDVELKYIEDWNRYEMTINGGILVIFDNWYICDEKNCENILCFKRSGEEFIYLSLPMGDSLDKEEIK